MSGESPTAYVRSGSVLGCHKYRLNRFNAPVTIWLLKYPLIAQ
jgi:hypothetical protein